MQALTELTNLTHFSEEKFWATEISQGFEWTTGRVAKDKPSGTES